MIYIEEVRSEEHLKDCKSSIDSQHKLSQEKPGHQVITQLGCKFVSVEFKLLSQLLLLDKHLSVGIALSGLQLKFILLSLRVVVNVMTFKQRLEGTSVLLQVFLYVVSLNLFLFISFLNFLECRVKVKHFVINPLQNQVNAPCHLAVSQLWRLRVFQLKPFIMLHLVSEKRKGNQAFSN